MIDGKMRKKKKKEKRKEKRGTAGYLIVYLKILLWMIKGLTRYSNNSTSQVLFQEYALPFLQKLFFQFTQKKTV